MQSDISAADRASGLLPEYVIDELRNNNDGHIQRIVEEVTKESSEIGGSPSTDPLILDETVVLLRLKHLLKLTNMKQKQRQM